jgi:hypothetical protein
MNSASSDTTSAVARLWASVAKAASSSPSVLASSITTSCPILRVASFNSRLAAAVVRLFGLTRSAINGVGEISSRKSSRRLSQSAFVITVTPVKLPPGRLKLATRPAATGSVPVAKTTGTVAAATRNTPAATSAAPAKRTATLRSISSAANCGSRSSRPSAQRNSIATFWPLT